MEVRGTDGKKRKITLTRTYGKSILERPDGFKFFYTLQPGRTPKEVEKYYWERGEGNNKMKYIK